MIAPDIEVGLIVLPLSLSLLLTALFAEAAKQAVSQTSEDSWDVSPVLGGQPVWIWFWSIPFSKRKRTKRMCWQGNFQSMDIPSNSRK
jgi:hypothetical protein